MKRFLSAFLRRVFRVRVEGFESWANVSGPVIVVANHVSYLDGLLLAAFSPIPLHYGVTADFARRQPWKFILDRLSSMGYGNYTPLDPHQPHGLRRLLKTLRSGGWVAIFPEGGISRTGRFGGVRPGVIALAKASGATILPVRISGPEKSVFGKAQGRFLLPRVSLLAVGAVPYRDPAELAESIQAVLG